MLIATRHISFVYEREKSMYIYIELCREASNSFNFSKHFYSHKNCPGPWLWTRSSLPAAPGPSPSTPTSTRSSCSTAPTEEPGRTTVIHVVHQPLQLRHFVHLSVCLYVMRSHWAPFFSTSIIHNYAQIFESIT